MTTGIFEIDDFQREVAASDEDDYEIPDGDVRKLFH